jgi:hypothetical protein
VHTAVILIALFAHFDFAATVVDPEMLEILSDVSERGARTTDDMEVAVFIVRNPAGHLSCLLWPHTASIRSAHYEGAMPPGTIALAHTHPIYAERPSRGDVEQAKRIGLPSYVVTRWHTYVVDPSTGRSIEVIRAKNWTRSNPPCGCSALKTEEASVVIRSSGRR